jgi:hypothetical protein
MICEERARSSVTASYAISRRGEGREGMKVRKMAHSERRLRQVALAWKSLLFDILSSPMVVLRASIVALFISEPSRRRSTKG